MTPTTFQDEVLQFVQLLEQSSLSEERKDYWLGRLRDGKFDDKDQQLFLEEMNEEIQNMDYAVKVTEEELAQDEAKLAQLEAQALPLLQKIAEELPAQIEADDKACRQEISQAKNEMIAELKVLREQGREKDMDAIRKKLMGGA